MAGPTKKRTHAVNPLGRGPGEKRLVLPKRQASRLVGAMDEARPAWRPPTYKEIQEMYEVLDALEREDMERW